MSRQILSEIFILTLLHAVASCKDILTKYFSQISSHTFRIRHDLRSFQTHVYYGNLKPQLSEMTSFRLYAT